MNEEQLQRYSITPSLARKPTASGDQLEMYVTLPRFEEDVEYRLFLVGTDCLTGEPLKKHLATFSRSCPTNSRTILPYYGTFEVFTQVVLNGMSLGECDRQELKLSHEPARPIITCRAEKKGDFYRLHFHGNCWKYARGKLWLYFAGRYQQLKAPDMLEGIITVYIASKEQPTIETIDKAIQIKFE